MILNGIFQKDTKSYIFNLFQKNIEDIINIKGQIFGSYKDKNTLYQMLKKNK